MDYEIQMTKMDLEYSETDQLTLKHGFYVAAGLSDYKNNDTIYDDPSYGQIKFYRKSWGLKNQTALRSFDDEDEGFIKWDELKSRTCDT